MALITPEQIRLVSPKCDYTLVATGLNSAAELFQINTNRRIRHWIATLYVESAGFTRLQENLNYSAPRLTQVWPKRFPTLQSAQPYAGNPVALAEKVYGGRMGNTSPGDGGRYLGRGYIQLTGKNNYAAASKGTGIDLVAKPELAASHAVAARIAGFYWSSNGLNQIVDVDGGEVKLMNVSESILKNEEDDLRQARRTVNGGLTGLDHVRKQLLRCGQVWS